MGLRPITLLVGPAGAGKPAVFRGLLLLQNSEHRTLPELGPPGLSEFQWVRSRRAGITDPSTLEAAVAELLLEATGPAWAAPWGGVRRGAPVRHPACAGLLMAPGC